MGSLLGQGWAREVHLGKACRQADRGEMGGEVPPFEDLKERMLFIEALETVKCLDEGVIESVAARIAGSAFRTA